MVNLKINLEKFVVDVGLSHRLCQYLRLLDLDVVVRIRMMHVPGIV